MKGHLLMFLGFAALGTAGPAAAREGEVGGIEFDCDTAADRFSQLFLPVPSGSFSITGTVAYRGSQPSDKHAAVASVALTVDGGAVGFTLSTVKGGGNRQPYAVVKWTADRGKAQG